MDYWYTFKIKALFTIDIINAKNEPEAAERANKIAGEFVNGLKGLEVLECEGEDQGETEEQTSEGEEDYEVYLIAKITGKEIVTAKNKGEAIGQAEELFLDNITRKEAIDLIGDNLTTEKVINEHGEVI